MEKLTMDKIVSLCKNRGYIYAGSEIYGGLANTWDYGPLGNELKDNVKAHILQPDGGAVAVGLIAQIVDAVKLAPTNIRAFSKPWNEYAAV